eukprot:4257349-Amphidinium_carterae.2
MARPCLARGKPQPPWRSKILERSCWVPAAWLRCAVPQYEETDCTVFKSKRCCTISWIVIAQRDALKPRKVCVVVYGPNVFQSRENCARYEQNAISFGFDTQECDHCAGVVQRKDLSEEKVMKDTVMGMK